MLGTEAIGTLVSVRAEPQEKGLGIKLSSTEGAGCLVMEVADHSPLVSAIQQGDRYSHVIKTMQLTVNFLNMHKHIHTYVCT